MGGRWLRDLASRALAAGVGLVLAVGLVEAGARLTGLRPTPIPADDAAAARSLWRHDARKGWFHEPHARGSHPIEGGPDRGEIRLNALGLRGPEVREEKAPGVRRVLVLGDSFVFGVGVDEEHLATTGLQRELLARTGLPHEVLNLGVSGYSTDQELLLFQELGPRLRPDAVVVVVCDNDLDGNLVDFAYHRYPKPFFEPGPGGLLLRHVPVPRLTRWQEAKLWLGQRSRAWNLVRSRQAPPGPLGTVVGAFQVAVPRRSAAGRVDLALALLLELDRAARAAGARFLVANTGHVGEDATPFRALRRGLAERGVRFLRLDGPLAAARRARPDGLWDFRRAEVRDSHWNVDAHALVGRLLAEALAGEAGAPAGDP